MKLISCYIQNFGCLSHYSLQFQPGITVIKEPNGFGKTTLAAFIRAMFYGFPRSGKSLERNDRKRYTPWQGGTFGGNLVFELEHVHYRIERTFGAAPKQDTFVLYTLEPLQRSTRFTDQIGQELFQLDADSFERSCLMQHLQGLTSLSTTAIQAKLNHLTEATDDMTAYDKAIAALRAKRAALLPYRGSGGSIALAQEEIRKLQSELSQLQPSKITLLEQQASKTSEQLAEAHSRLQSVRSQITASSELAGKEFLQKQEAELARSIREVQKEILSIRQQYPVPFPSEERLRDLLTAAEQLHALQSSEDHTALMAAPSAQTVSSCMQIHQQLQRLHLQADSMQLPATERTELNALQAFFHNEVPSDECLALYAAASDHKRISFFPVLLLLCVCAALAGGILWVMRYVQLGAFFGISGIAALVGILVFRCLFRSGADSGKRIRNAHSPDAGLRQFLSRYYEDGISDPQSALAELRRKKESLTALQIKQEGLAVSRYETLQQIQKLETALRQQISPFVSSQTPLEQALFELQTQQIQGESLKQQQLAQSRRETELEDLLHAALSEYLSKESCTDRSSILTLYQAAQRYHALELQLEFFMRQQEDLKAQCPAPVTSVPQTLQTLKEQESHLSSEIDTLTRQLLQERQQILTLQNELNQLAEKEDMLEYWTTQHMQEQTTAARLDKTIHYLETAKHNLSHSYLHQIHQRFQHYLKKLEAVDGGNSFIASDLTVALEQEGEARPLPYFSAGSVDLIMLCMRLALVDTLFPDTEPLLILDDPFVNLDDRHTELALKLLQELSQDHQILYLVCHSSRC